MIPGLSVSSAARARRAARADVWLDTGSIAGATLDFHADANSRSLNLETVFTEASPGDVPAATYEWRVLGQLATYAWARPSHLIRPDTAGLHPYGIKQALGKILLPDGLQGQVIQVRATHGTAVRVATATVPTPPASAYAGTATRYVSMTGTDSGAGGSGAPWRSLQYAFTNSVSGDIIQAASGSYAAAGIGQPDGTTFRAATAIKDEDNSRTLVAESVRTVIEPRGTDGWPAVAAPTGATDTDLTGRTPARIAPWTAYTVTTPGLHGASAISRTCWKWTGSPITDLTTIGHHTTRKGQMTMIPVRSRTVSGALSTPAGWLELHRTNLDYSGSTIPGAWSDGAGNVYLDCPGLDPNTVYWTLGGTLTQGVGFKFDGEDQAVAGVEVRGMFHAFNATSTARNYLMERFYLQNNCFGLDPGGVSNAWRTTGVASAYPERGTFRYFYDRQDGLWSLDQTTRRMVSWNGVKSSTTRADGTTEARSLAAYQERRTIGRTIGWKWLEVHDGVVDGQFDFAGCFADTSDQYACWGTDFWNLTVEGAADDMFDLSRWGGAQACWSSRFEGSLTTIGMAPYWGDFLMYDVVSWGNTQRGLGKKNDGTASPLCTFWKYGDGGGGPSGRVQLVNVTVWSDRGGTSALTDTVYGANPAGGGAVGSTGIPDFYAENVIFRTTQGTRLIMATGKLSIRNSEVHDAGTNTGALRQGLHPEAHTPGTIRTEANLVALKAAYPGAFDGLNAAQPIVINVATIDAALGDPVNGDLSTALLGVRLAGLHDDLTAVPMGAISNLTLEAAVVQASVGLKKSFNYHPVGKGQRLNSSDASGDTDPSVIAPFTAAHHLYDYTIGDESYRNLQQSTYGGADHAYLDYKFSINALGPVDATRAGAPTTGTYNNYANSVTGVSGYKDFSTALHPTANVFIRVNGGTYNGSRMWEDQSFSGTNRLFLMDPASSLWRSHLVSKLNSFLSTYGYDGQFLDNVDLSLHRFHSSGQARHEGGQTGAFSHGGSGIVGYSSTAGSKISDSNYSTTWRAAMGGLCQYVRANMTGSKWLFANVTNSEFPSAAFDDMDVVAVGGVHGLPVAPGLDGWMDEAWVCFPTAWKASGYGSTDEWEGQLLKAERAVSQGKHYFCMSQSDGPIASMSTTSPDYSKHRYGLGSYLLIASWDTTTGPLGTRKAIPLTSFRHTSYSYTSPIADYFKMRTISDEAQVAALGYPIADRVQDSANVWHRNYQNGTVTVNNSSHTVTYT